MNNFSHVGTTSLFSIIKSAKFLIHTFFVSITVLRISAAIGMMKSLLKRLTDDKGKGERVQKLLTAY